MKQPKLSHRQYLALYWLVLGSCTHEKLITHVGSWFSITRLVKEGYIEEAYTLKHEKQRYYITSKGKEELNNTLKYYKSIDYRREHYVPD